MQKYFTRLKSTIIKNYIGRKKEGMISLFYNTKNKKFIAVPKNMEHSEFISRISNTTLQDIKDNPEAFSHFIPVTIIIAENQFASIIIGISSLEMGFDVFHKKTDLVNAKNATLLMLERGPLPIKNNFKQFISKKYAY